jgi:iron complex outermembrane receptor protein
MYKRIPTFLLLMFILSTSTLISAAPQEQETTKTEQKEKKPTRSQPPIPHFTEEVEVVAKAPEAVPSVSSPSLFVVENETIEKVTDYNLTKSLSYTTGTYVSTGSKNEASLQIRGLSSSKIALLYDGIPIYEPYFGSFDLNSIVAEEVESIKVLKGATSVLYGPNVMGGAVNVLTKRPDKDTASVVSSYGSFDDVGVAATGTARRGKFGMLGSFSYNSSDDFQYKNDDGERVTRLNSDFDTKNITGKLYYYPGESSEIMAEAGYVTSEYGIPWATEIYRPRYWRFSDWDRYLFNVGGSFPLADKGYLKARGYYVKHHNVLDAYKTEDLNKMSWQSTFNNYSYGTFLLGSVLLNMRNELKFSANVKSDHAKTQDDIDAEWEQFSQQTLSFGAEDHFNLTDQWVMMAGASLDYLNKEEGNNKTAVNPIVGVRYDPKPYFNLSTTFSQKSRFPTMKDLYSSTAGNPDLREERSTNLELGFAYERQIGLTGAVFYNRIRDLIQSIRTPEGWKMPTNVGSARITGFELGLQKNLESMKLSLNYTFLDSKDLDLDQPLPLVPSSQINFMFDVLPRHDWRLSLWGTGALGIQTTYKDDILTVPDYFVLNAGITKTFHVFEIFARAENLLDASYVTEPGFPMPARKFRVALRLRYQRN